MARVEEKIHKLKYPGAIDADGHILESVKCWEEYCEAKYRANAVRMKQDKDGLEYLEINGVPSRVNRGGNFGAVAQMGQVTREKGEFDPRIKYGERLPLGAADAKERVERLDLEGLDAAIIYPSLELTWETECDDVDYAQAMCRAYNRWVTDWCTDSGGRLIPVAHLSLGDPKAAADELSSRLAGLGLACARIAITAQTATSLTIQNDWNASATITAVAVTDPITGALRGEQIVYTYTAGTGELTRQEIGVDGAAVVIAAGIINLAFTYLDQDNNVAIAAANIRTVTITITTQQSAGQPQVTMVNRVRLRNRPTA